MLTRRLQARCSSLLMRKDGVDLKCKADAEGEVAA